MAEEGESYECGVAELERLKRERDFSLVVYAESCPACEYLQELLGEVEVKGDLAELAIGGGEPCREAVRRLGVSAVPTVIKFKGGEEVDRFTPSMDRERDKKKLGELLG